MIDKHLVSPKLKALQRRGCRISMFPLFGQFELGKCVHTVTGRQPILGFMRSFSVHQS